MKNLILGLFLVATAASAQAAKKPAAGAKNCASLLQSQNDHEFSYIEEQWNEIGEDYGEDLWAADPIRVPIELSGNPVTLKAALQINDADVISSGQKALTQFRRILQLEGGISFEMAENPMGEYERQPRYDEGNDRFASLYYFLQNNLAEKNENAANKVRHIFLFRKIGDPYVNKNERVYTLAIVEGGNSQWVSTLNISRIDRGAPLAARMTYIETEIKPVPASDSLRSAARKTADQWRDDNISSGGATIMHAGTLKSGDTNNLAALANDVFHLEFKKKFGQDVPEGFTATSEGGSASPRLLNKLANAFLLSQALTPGKKDNLNKFLEPMNALLPKLGNARDNYIYVSRMPLEINAGEKEKEVISGFVLNKKTHKILTFFFVEGDV